VPVIRTIKSEAAFTIVEVMVAVCILMLVTSGGMAALLTINRNSASTRLFTSARAIVQRNIDNALAIPFSSSIQPAILATTSGAVVYDDDGNGDNLVNMMVATDGVTVPVKGTLYRTVSVLADTSGAELRQVTFRIDYTYLRRSFSYQMATVRARD
jgi:type II secretory pathway pseudopilin PulG